jgi:hypothetical protein
MLARQEAMYSGIASQIRLGAIVFLGTPHRGSDSAATLHLVLSATLGSKAYIQELMRNSGTILNLNEDFRHCASELKLWSFYETLPTSVAGKSTVSRR